MIYLDNAATSGQKPKAVAEAMVATLNSAGNAGRGVNDASLQAARTIFDTRERLATLLHAESPLRIAFTCNITESLNTAIKGLFRRGDHVITTVMEHNSVLRPLYEMEKQGVELTFLSCDEKGRLHMEELEPSIRPNTKAVICTHASNLTGNINDLKKIGEICKKHGLLFLVDAAQTAGVFPIDVQKMNIDVLCFTGHKSLFGPQGTGGLYVRDGLEIHPLKSGGSGVESFRKVHPTAMPTALESGTMNTPGIAGLGAAVAFLQEIGIETIREKEEQLWRYFYENIKDIEGIRFLGDLEAKTHAPIVTFNFMDYDSAEVSDELWDSYSIATRAGAHCAPLMHRSFGTEEQGAVRFSFSYFNTMEEVEQAVKAVKEICHE